MNSVEKQTFSYRPVEVDGVKYEYCHFDHCNMIYAGGVYSMNGCSFDFCEWEMRGPAQRTMMLLHHLYQVPGMQDFIENTFEAIRSGKQPAD